MRVNRKVLDDVKDRLNKVQGILGNIEYAIEDEENAVRLFSAVLDIFDKDVGTDDDGNILPEHKEKALLAEGITSWLAQRRM